MRKAAPETYGNAPPPDQAARDAIIAERDRNVVVIAGAGTGKTKTIIDRAVALLAPQTATELPIDIRRMALITFTRRAAGELRFRIREHLLRELEESARTDATRTDRLRNALANLDAAFIGTIHGFADRLLRLRPVEAQLSPAYTLVEDNAELVRETFWRLRRAAEAGTLYAALGAFGTTLPPALINEAAGTLRAAVRAALQMERAESAFGQLASLEGTLARMIDTRDVDVELPPIPDPELAAACDAVQRLREMLATMRGDGLGHRRVRRIVSALLHLQAADEPAEAVRIVLEARRGRQLYKGRDFNDDACGFSIYKAIYAERAMRDSLAEKLRGPHRWLATRLVRLFPVVRAMYDRVKVEHEVVDYLDLLINLRNLLRDNRAARQFYQSLFDHVFVDEFQDTDPLQCEIVFYLCEDTGHAAATTRWDSLILAPGKLTIVGDPKQSIYRFRRADITMYGRAIECLLAGGALEQRLDTNFRSRPELISFFNQQLGKALGRSDGPAFDAQTGRANYEDLSPTATMPAGGIAVHILPYADDAQDGLLAPEGRAVEAVMLARYVRMLLRSQRPVRDPDTNDARPIRAGDIAVLACVTTNLPLLLRQLDALGIEYTARGGALFLGHPIVRQYLLGLRALADRDDGVAVAALLRPPFFAVDWSDAVADRAGGGGPVSEHQARMQEAQSVITALRGQRHAQSPGTTARDLIERTALGRAAAVGHNGRQTLAALYEVAAEVDRRAAIEGLDYDATTELFRTWAESPVFLDAPAPIDPSALQVMTIHGAKGLEFPVVILWDGFQTFSEPSFGSVWQVDRDGHAWALGLGAVAVEHPVGAHLIDHEKQFGEQERRRMYYVAATRARDLLVLPVPHTKRKGLRSACGELADGVDSASVQTFETFRLRQPPLWGRREERAEHPAIVGNAALQDHLDAARRNFDVALERAARPLASPTAVTHEATERSDEDLSLDGLRAEKAAGGRFGPLFGSTVHRAIELILSGAADTPPAAVRLAALEVGLTEHLAEATADVDRAGQVLTAIGVGRDPQLTMVTEYPLVMARHDGALLSGFVDLLLWDAHHVTVIDFKTDRPVGGDVAVAYPRYTRQLRLYGDMLHTARLVGTRQLRLGVLLTASGELRWLD